MGRRARSDNRANFIKITFAKNAEKQLTVQGFFFHICRQIVIGCGYKPGNKTVANVYNGARLF